MKKLMLAVSAVAIAAVANAGMVKWTISNVYAGNDTALASGQLYLFNNATIASTAIAAAIQEAWTDGYGTPAVKGANGLAAFLNDKALGKGGTAYTMASSTAGTFSAPSAGVDNSTLGLSGGTSYTLYGVVFDTTVDSFADSTKFYVTSTKTATTKADTATTTTTFGIGSQEAASQVAGNWQTVPEPTSGLLMLLGMAGLALRRRRA